MDASILEDLGLTQAEIKVYISLLEMGSSSAGHVLEKTGLQNSVVHRALNSLIQKGLISYILESKKRIYQASDPENFHDFINNKINRFDDLLPELKKIQNKSKLQTSAEVLRGKRGLNQLYMTLLNFGKGEYNTFGGGSSVTYDVMGEDWWTALHTKRIAKKIPCRQVFDETIRDFGNQLTKRKITKIKFLPKEYAQLQETIIIGEFVGIAIFTENPYGLLIRDKVVAESYRKQFELLWKLAKK